MPPCCPAAWPLARCRGTRHPGRGETDAGARATGSLAGPRDCQPGAPVPPWPHGSNDPCHTHAADAVFLLLVRYQGESNPTALRPHLLGRAGVKPATRGCQPRALSTELPTLDHAHFEAVRGIRRGQSTDGCLPHRRHAPTEGNPNPCVRRPADQLAAASRLQPRTSRIREHDNASRNDSLLRTFADFAAPTPTPHMSARRVPLARGHSACDRRAQSTRPIRIAHARRNQANKKAPPVLRPTGLGESAFTAKSAGRTSGDFVRAIADEGQTLELRRKRDVTAGDEHGRLPMFRRAGPVVHRARRGAGDGLASAYSSERRHG